MVMVSDGPNDNETTFGDDAEFGLRQLNLQIKGLIPGDPDAVIWAVNVTTSAMTCTSSIPNAGTYLVPVPVLRTTPPRPGGYLRRGSVAMRTTTWTSPRG